MNAPLLNRTQQLYIRKTFQMFFQNRHPDDEHICIEILDKLTVKERIFMRTIYLDVVKKFDERVESCAKKAAIPTAYAWVLLRVCECRYAAKKGWIRGDENG